MAENNNGSANLAWFLAGAALGAAAALLWAPQPGTDTRDYIRRRGVEGRERFSKSGREVFERGRELYDRGRELADDAAELFEKGKKDAGELFERGKKTVRQTKSGEEAAEAESGS